MAKLNVFLACTIIGAMEPRQNQCTGYFITNALDVVKPKKSIVEVIIMIIDPRFEHFWNCGRKPIPPPSSKKVISAVLKPVQCACGQMDVGGVDVGRMQKETMR